MDLDAILARNQKLALVDELATVNAPGSRHPKRWQDVKELFDAGIDVFTTIIVYNTSTAGRTLCARLPARKFGRPCPTAC